MSDLLFSDRDRSNILTDIARTQQTAQPAAMDWTSPETIGRGINDLVYELPKIGAKVAGFIGGAAVDLAADAVYTPAEIAARTVGATDFADYLAARNKERDDFRRSMMFTPETDGAAAQVIGPLAQYVTASILGSRLGVGAGPLGAELAGAATFGVVSGRDRELMYRDQGVDQQTARELAVSGGLTDFASALLPAGVGKTLAQRIAFGLGSNVGLGMADRFASNAYLRSAGYEDAASLYQWSDPVSITLDALLGSAFGGLSHYEAKQAARATEQAVSGQRDYGAIEWSRERSVQDVAENLTPLDQQIAGAVYEGLIDADTAAQRLAQMRRTRTEGDADVDAFLVVMEELGKRDRERGKPTDQSNPDIPPDLLYVVEERAAMYEEGGHSRSDAERLAQKDVREKWEVLGLPGQPSSDQIAAAFVMADKLRAEIGSAPGVPRNITAAQLQAAALERAAQQMADDQAVAVDDLFAQAVAARALEGRFKSLTQWLIERGGLRDEGGEVSTAIGGRSGRDTRIVGLLNDKGGLSLDDATLYAWEQGYLRGAERPTTDALIMALRDEAAGEKVYREADERDLADVREGRRIAEAFAREGIDINADDGALRAAIEAFVRDQFAPHKPSPDAPRVIEAVEAALAEAGADDAEIAEIRAAAAEVDARVREGEARLRGMGVDPDLLASRGESPVRFAVKPPKRLWRGVRPSLDDPSRMGRGIARLGRGLYSTPDRAFAEGFAKNAETGQIDGQVLEFSPEEAFPRNPLVIDPRRGSFDDWLLRESGESRMTAFEKKWPDPGVFVRSRGYDGVVMGDEVVRYVNEDGTLRTEETDTSPNARRSGDPMLARSLDPMGFYSPAYETALAVPDNIWSMGYAAVRNTMTKGKALAGEGARVADEIKFLGLDDAFAGTKLRGAELRDAVMQAIELQRLVLVERWNRYDPANPPLRGRIRDTGSVYVLEMDGGLTRNFATRAEAEAAQGEYTRSLGQTSASAQDAGIRRGPGDLRLPGDDPVFELRLKLQPGTPGSDFQSHWSRAPSNDDGVVVSIRGEERIDDAGRHTLFGGEVQSDMAQQVRASKERLDENVTKLGMFDAALRDAPDGSWFVVTEKSVTAHADKNAADGQALRKGGNVMSAAGVERERRIAQNAVDAMKAQVADTANYPLTAKTSQWTNFAVRGMVYRAARDGFDSVSFPTGETSTLIQGNDSAAKHYDTNVKGALEKVAAAFGGRVREGGVQYDLNPRDWADAPPEQAEQTLAGIFDRLPAGIKSRLRQNLAVMKLADDGEFYISNGRDPRDADASGFPRTHWDYTLRREAGNNPIVAAYQIWVQGAVIFDEPGAFEQMLQVAAEGDATVSDAVRAAFKKAGTDNATAYVLDITPAMRAQILERGMPMFARATPEAAPRSLAADLRARLAPTLLRLGKLLPADYVQVVQSIADLPEDIRRRLGDADVTGLKGLADRANGRVYLIADNIRPAELKGLMLHEVGVHLGLRKMVGDRRFNELLAQLQAMRDAGQPDAVAAFKRAEAFALLEEHIPEEAFAYLVETAPELPLVRRILAMLAEWSNKFLGTRFATPEDIALGKLEAGELLTVADMRELVAAALRKFRAERESTRVVGKMEGLAAAKRNADIPQGEPVPREIEQVAGLRGVFAMASALKFGTNRDLKLAMQNRVRTLAEGAGVDLSQRTVEADAFLTRMAVSDALVALETNPGAVGWYDTTVTKALNIVSLIHPEIATDPQAKFAFVWALAVTSNGAKVDANFELAEKAYRHFRKTKKMPTNIGVGTAKKAMNEGLALYNTLVKKHGVDRVMEFMTTKTTVKEVKAFAGKNISGENLTTEVFGAAALGPKIGNGFFMNLYGEFGQITIDRWFMRTWGRWLGNLIEENPKQVEASRKKIEGLIDIMSPEEREAFGAIIDMPVTKDNIDALALAIRKNTADEETRKQMARVGLVGHNSLSMLDDVLGEVTGDGERLSVGDELRKAANNLVKYLDGQKEQPSGPPERGRIRAIMAAALEELRKTHPALTMADLQALLWYPEKRLYDSAKADETKTGYEDDEAPDYANAAAGLARKQGVDEQRIVEALGRDRVSADVGAGAARPRQRGGADAGSAPGGASESPEDLIRGQGPLPAPIGFNLKTGLMASKAYDPLDATLAENPGLTLPNGHDAAEAVRVARLNKTKAEAMGEAFQTAAACALKAGMSPRAQMGYAEMIAGLTVGAAGGAVFANSAIPLMRQAAAEETGLSRMEQMNRELEGMLDGILYNPERPLTEDEKRVASYYDMLKEAPGVRSNQYPEGVAPGDRFFAGEASARMGGIEPAGAEQ